MDFVALMEDSLKSPWLDRTAVELECWNNIVLSKTTISSSCFEPDKYEVPADVPESVLSNCDEFLCSFALEKLHGELKLLANFMGRKFHRFIKNQRSFEKENF